MLADLFCQVIRDVESEVVAWFHQNADAEPDRDDLPLLMKYNVRGSEEDIARLRAKIENFLEDCDAVDGEREDDPDFLTYSGFIAFYERPESN